MGGMGIFPGDEAGDGDKWIWSGGSRKRFLISGCKLWVEVL